MADTNTELAPNGLPFLPWPDGVPGGEPRLPAERILGHGVRRDENQGKLDQYLGRFDFTERETARKNQSLTKLLEYEKRLAEWEALDHLVRAQTKRPTIND